MTSFKECTDTIKWEVGGRKIRPEDAGIWRYCAASGFRYNIEDLVPDENGDLVHPRFLFDPQPEPFDFA